MVRIDATSLSAVLLACGYYLFALIVARPKRDRRSIVPQYEPPPGLSPAMVRYIRKEDFDDRTFWAAVLSLVSKDLATIESQDDVTGLRPAGSAQHPPSLPNEERLLLRRVVAGSKKRGMPISMLDERTSAVAGEMADSLRREIVGNMYVENKTYVIGGILFSLIALCLVARPSGRDGWMALILGLAVMGPGAFYFLFLALRIRDVCLAACEKLSGTVIARGLILLGLSLPCVAAIALGSVVLTTNFGWPTIATAALLTGITLWFSRTIKAPTALGISRLDQIAGFRLFLQSVEHLPMDRDESPSTHAGVYEKYLPYAVALEVDQKWSDKLVALSSTVHRREALLSAHSFYLGMWNGKPVEMVFGPPPSQGRGF